MVHIGRKFSAIDSSNIWFVEFFRYYQNDNRIHKHVVLPRLAQGIDTEDYQNIQYSPFKCSYFGQMYELAFSEVFASSP